MDKSLLNTATAVMFSGMLAGAACAQPAQPAKPADPASPAIAKGAYKYQTLDVPGAPGTAIYGINSGGTTVGASGGLSPFSNAPLKGFVHAGAFTTIVIPGATDTTARGINGAGTIVGTYDDNSYIRTPVGQVTAISPLSGTVSLGASALNLYEEIVGGLSDANHTHGFLRDQNGTFYLIDVPDASFTIAAGVNDNLEVVGYYDTSTGTRGFSILCKRWPLQGRVECTNATLMTIAVPGAGNTDAFGINNRGQIVGAFNADPQIPGEHGFLYSNGRFTQIDVPGATTTDATAINDNGVIAGQFFDKTGNVHGFIATPLIASKPGYKG